jgi:tetratricopeptide (TPR) repeat protein
LKTLVLCLVLPACLAALSPADQHLSTAQKLLRRGREKDARLELKAVLALEPDRSEALALLASLDGGPVPLSAAAKAAPAGPAAMEAALAEQVEASLARARSAYRESELQAATAAYREALRQVPDQAEALAGLKRLDDEAYHRDADQPFDHAVADLYEAALREVRKGRLVEARKKLEEARALNPAQPQLLRALGWVAAGAEQEQAGRDAQSLVLEGQRRAAEGEDAKAAAAFSAALQASPGLQAAQAGLDQVRERNRGKVEALLKKAASASASGDWSGTAQAAELALALDPANTAAKESLAQAKAKQAGQRDAAAQRREADRLYNGGVEAWQAGDLALAASRFRETLTVSPEDKEAAQALQAVQRKLEERADKDRADAAQLLKEGRRYEGLGALEQALQAYERALAKDPALAEAAEAKSGLEKRLKGL